MSIANNINSETIIIFMAALIMGAAIGITYRIFNKDSRNMTLTLGVLPFLVVVVLSVVNGNVGAAIGIAGVFSLVRFRSVPGNSKDISSIFFAMGVGAVLSTGNILFAAVVTVILCVVFALYEKINKNKEEKQLKISIPEDMNNNDLFGSEFERYLNSYRLEKVKTTSMGSLYELTYKVVFKDVNKQKDFIDEIRVKNGNLPISISNIYENEQL